ncbi:MULTISPECIES: TetR/AcrR family transcriptional regulator [unclassified Bradyrhizobium]|jgi:AcrR family transcriptional regulator|uniref:TetR/AcrR family transcriptional regulator n=1 Tax=unclassified Bradyrhizobium TaxID=2631580 RepID=UPI001FF79202|nr:MULTISPECIES: TetR/AcrR family transcriptional regulator [unclassified Bradyrhizobium]MCK1519277.1 TetR/AcrR family transcriptional regulator [Bradyrhizobium sp. 17]UPJ70039.1 TetR/AcrR family transcriptional regulator [Bradyrhizobium sp. 187]
MTSDTKAKMVAGAADLMSRRGVNATSMREVVRHTGTPRGSISHHFPGGKQQLIEDAIAFAGAQVSGPLQHLTNARGAIAGLRAFIALWRKTLEQTNYRAGCPILAVAVEQYVSETTERESVGEQEVQRHLLDLAQRVFADWQQILSAALKREGLAAPRARRLATLVVASVEGTVAMCRAARSAQPLEEVSQELELLLKGAIEKQ